MRTLIAGEGGEVLVAAATSTDGIGETVALACEGMAATTRTPSGLPVHPVDALADSMPEAIAIERVLVTSCEGNTRASIESWATARGLAVERWAPSRLRPPDGTRVVAVGSRSTGSGKTATVRRVARALRASGVSVAVARHPIANLLHWGRFIATVVRSPAELTGARPIEEREELAPLVGAGIPVVTGLDAESVLRMAAAEAGEAGVVVWDGGGASRPWVVPDLDLVVVDLLRPFDVDEDDRVGQADAVILA